MCGGCDVTVVEVLECRFLGQGISCSVQALQNHVDQEHDVHTCSRIASRSFYVSDLVEMRARHMEYLMPSNPAHASTPGLK